MLYLDSSAVVKLYLFEAESQTVEALVQGHTPLLFTSIVAYPEVLSTLVRALRARRISQRDYQLARRQSSGSRDRKSVV